MKVAAAVSMVADHVGSLWFHRSVPALDAVGRVAFPLFAYAAAVAVARVREPAGHLRSVGRLLALAVAVEPVSHLCRPDYPAANVLFTLALGTALAAAWPALSTAWRGGLVAAVLASTGFVPGLEFGTAGVLLPALLLTTARRERGALAALVVTAVCLNLANLTWAAAGPPGFLRDFLLRAVRDAAVVAVVPLAVVHACGALPGDGRLLPKYFLHVFYPAHLLVLWATA